MTDVAHGEIRIETLDEGALAELRRLEAEVERSMGKIDRMRAEAQVGADVSELRRDLAEAERELKEFDGKTAKAHAKIDEDQRRADRDRLKRIRDLKREELDSAQQRLSGLRRENKELDLTNQRIKVIERAEQQRAQVFERAARQRSDSLRREANERAALDRSREQAMNKLHGLALRDDRNRERSIAKLERERTMLPRLQRQYVELSQTLDRLGKVRRKINAPGNTKAELAVDLKTAEVKAKMVALRAELERLGGPIDLDVDAKPGVRLGQHLRRMFDRHGISGVAFGLGATAADGIVNGFRRRFSPRAIGTYIRSGFARVGDFFDRLGEMTVRLGPFTLSIAQLGFALATLGPAVTSIVGALGSLVSVTGAGVLGIGALSAGFLGGAIPAAIGFAAVLKPVAAQLRQVFAASRSYNDAVLKYGRGSDQAKTKLEQFNRTLKGVNEETKQAFLASTRLSTRWNDLTAPARQRAFHVIGEGLRFASDNLGSFARLTVRTFSVADKGLSRWIKGLNSVEGRRILSTMFDNFNKSLGPLLHGLGDIVAWLGRIGAVASNALPGLFRGFRRWASDLLHSSDNAAAFERKINRLIGAARTMGHFFMAAGRFLLSFFNPGVKAGEQLVRTMTRALNSWTRFNQSVEGRRSLANYFNNAVDGTTQLFRAFAPLIAAFVQWTTALAPFFTSFLRGATYVARFVASLTRLLGMGNGLRTLAITLGGMWAIGKIGAATRAVFGFVAALTGLSRAREAVMAADAGLGVGGFVGALFGRGGGKAAANEVAMVTREGGALKIVIQDLAAGGAGAAGGRGLGALGPLLARLGPRMALSATGAGALAVGLLEVGHQIDKATGGVSRATPAFDQQARSWSALKDVYSKLSKVLGDGTDDWSDLAKAFPEIQDATDAARDSFVRIRGATHDVGVAFNQSRISLAQAKQALASTKKGTLEHQQALVNYRHELESVAQGERRWAQAKTAMRQAAQNEVEGVKQMIASAKDQGTLDAQTQRWLYSQLAAAQNRQASVAANLARSYRGMATLTGQAEQAIGRLIRTGNKSLAIRIATKFENPQDVGRVARNASAALKSGVSAKLVMRIIADSNNVEQAIRRLNAQRLQEKRLKIISEGGPQALAVLRKLVGEKLAPKVQKILASDGDAKSKIAALIALGIPPKTAKMLGENSDALAKAAQANAQVLKTLSQIIQRTIANPPGLFASLPAVFQAVVRTITGAKATGGPYSPQEKAAMSVGVPPGLGNLPVIGKEATKGGRKVNSPTLLTGEENRTEFVIATNPAYRNSNLGYLKMAAAALGVTMARKGHRGYMPRRNAEPDNLKAVRHYEKVRQEEDDQTRKIDIAQSKVKEPDTFVKQVGTDSNGDALYDVDQGKIDSYGAQLAKIRKLYDELINRIMVRLADAADSAYRSLSRFRRTRNSNIDRWQNLIERDQRIMRQPLAGSEEAKRKQQDRKDRAQKRIDDNKGKIDQAVSEIDASKDTEQGIKEDQHDAKFRTQEYGVERGDLTDTIKNIGAQAAAEKESANPKSAGGTSDPGSTGPTAAETRIAALEAELAMSEAGLGGRDVRTILGELATAENERIKEAQAMLGDDDKTNDVEAYGIIQQAANAIKDLNTQLGNLTSAIGAEQLTLGSARFDLLKTFGGNLAAGTRLAAMTPPAAATRVRFPGTPMPGQIPFPGSPQQPIPGYPAGYQGQYNMPTGGDVNITNNFREQPADPHTWSRNVAYELKTI